MFRMSYNVFPQTMLLGLASIQSWIAMFTSMFPHLCKYIRQGWLLGLRVLTSKVLFTVITKFPVTPWFLQWVFCSYKTGQVWLYLKDLLWSVVWVPFQLILVKGGLESVKKHMEKWSAVYPGEISSLSVTVWITLAVFIGHYLSTIALNVSPI